MEEFDKRLKAMAEKEECIVPEGFDKRVQDVLENLPSQVKKKGPSAVKGVLIAVAVCAALLCTAFAASPGLREMLSTALGGFAPYAQEQEDKTYLVDGFELKVLSALSDGSTLRVYVQARDLEGDRLSGEMEPYGEVNVLSEAGMTEEGAMRSFSFDSGHAVYDEESKTALLVFTSWAQGMGDLKDAKLDIRHIYDHVSDIEYERIPDDELPEGVTVGGTEGEVSLTLLRPLTDFKLNDVQLTIPLEVESMPKLTFGPDSELVKGINAELAELSPLGLTVQILMGKDFTALFQEPVRARMADGTEIEYEAGGGQMPTGQGSYIDQETGEYGWIYVWNFSEPLDLDQAEGIYVGGEYYSIK